MTAADAAPDLAASHRLMSEGAYGAAAEGFAALAATSPLDSDLPAFHAMALAKLGALDAAEAVIAPALSLRL